MKKRKLSKSAYGEIDGKNYIPFVNSGDKKGGNFPILVMGAVLAVIFAASTAYSGMKAGLTVAAGIPGAILGSGMVAAFARKKGILGKNILQGMSSGGESIASGMIYVLPAIILIGGKVHFWMGFIVGITAVLFAIGSASLVRNYMVVQEHGKLMYPESTAIAEALVASEGDKDSLKKMGLGFGIGGVITALTTQVFGWCNDTLTLKSDSFYKWEGTMQANPMLAGIGFVIGLKVSMTVMAGSILANFAIAPLVSYFTQMAAGSHVAWNNTAIKVSTMQITDITGSYIKYIGAGMMLAGGIIGAVKLIPVIYTSLKQTLTAQKNGSNEKNIIGILSMFAGVVFTFIAGLIISHNFLMALVGALISLILALLFIIVSARLAGTIGCSNEPVSGMTIAALVIMTLVFVVMGWTNNHATEILLMFGVFVVTCISVGGGYMQTQKVNFIIGGSVNEMNKFYMIAGIIGVAVVVGITVLLTPQLRIQGANPPFALPQANLIATLTSGIMSGNLPWVMIIVGAIMAIVMWMLDLPIMTVALGFYLPMATTSIIFVGGLVRFLIEKTTKDKQLLDSRTQSGISFSSGLIAGGSIIGLFGIILHVTGVLSTKVPKGFAAGNGMALILLVILIISMIWPLYRIRKKD